MSALILPSSCDGAAQVPGKSTMQAHIEKRIKEMDKIAAELTAKAERNKWPKQKLALKLEQRLKTYLKKNEPVLNDIKKIEVVKRPKPVFEVA